jgi:tetratricopeptide (TPR) repeat protein
MSRWTKLFEEIVEARAAKKSPRFNDYHTARIAYENYLKNHKDLLVPSGGPTPTARQEAKNSPELEKIEELFKKSIEGADKVNDYSDVATAYQQLGQLYYYQGRLEESKSALLKSLDIFSGLASLDKSHKDAQSDTHYFLGLTLIDMKDFNGAEKELKTSTAIDMATGNKYNVEYYGKLAMARLDERRKMNNNP